MRRLNVINRKHALKKVKELDAFPKVEESYQEKTATGGGISVVVLIFIAILVWSEVGYYSTTDLIYKYEVDSDHSSKLKINADITVAMKCSDVGADVLDMTGQSANTFGELQHDDAYFELSPDQRQYFTSLQYLNDYLRNQYHAVHKFLWKSGFSGQSGNMPASEDNPDRPKDACRIHGTLTVNKVAGNLHVTVGKSFFWPSGKRVHLTHMVHSRGLVEQSDYNFSHRIIHFSYGSPTSGVVNPLDGEEKVTTSNYHMFQYFIQVVPTEVDTTLKHVSTYQYSVTESNRTIDHSQGSHGVPGIFFKYDLSFLKVKVREEHKPYWQFLVRLCGIIGGIFATSGILHAMIQFVIDVACCKYHWGKYNTPKEPVGETVPVQSLAADYTPLPESTPTINLLPLDQEAPT
ncbi:Endoplasmic reticulum-Golgi intermediate compartment protein 2 [Lamellibrachia satsuma]|nr:Endoplasmic reticulum-Golgi intermediate compartment protein 2 [Lamellibrachia satsuma]